MLAIVLRLTTIGSRFLQVGLLAHYLDVKEFGTYGLLVAMVAFSVFAVGMDFYSYSTRQFILSDSSRWPIFLQSQTQFSLAAYAVALPTLSVGFVIGWFPTELYAWFLCILPLEHGCLELDRILIAMGQQLAAAAAVFMRQGVQFIILAPTLFALPGLRDLTTVLLFWIGSNTLSLVFSMRRVRRDANWTRGTSVDWRWVRAGLRTSILFLVGTLCLRALFTVDRQFVYLWAKSDVLAAYTLFTSLAAGVTSVVASSVHQFIYPRLVAAAGSLDRRSFLRGLLSLSWQTFAALGILIGLLLGLSGPILGMIGKSEYIDLSSMFPWILLCTFVYNLSLIPHFGLYALHADRMIVLITVASVLVFLVISLLFRGTGAVPAVLLGVCAASLVLLAGKSLGLARHLRQLSP